MMNQETFKVQIQATYIEHIQTKHFPFHNKMSHMYLNGVNFFISGLLCHPKRADASLLFTFQCCSFHMLRTMTPCSAVCTLIASHDYLYIPNSMVVNGKNKITVATNYFTSKIFSHLNFISLLRPIFEHTMPEILSQFTRNTWNIRAISWRKKWLGRHSGPDIQILNHHSSFH